MASTTTQGSGNKNNNGGTIMAAGNIANSLRWRALTLINNAIPALRNWGKPVSGFNQGNTAVQLGAGVAITAITQSGSTGYINIQKSSHGLAVGDYITVYDCDVAAYNTPMRVTAVTDANNVKTDCVYTVNPSSAHGSYKPFSGLWNAMTKNCYITFFVGKDTAGNVLTGLRNPAGDAGARNTLLYGQGNNRYNITGWNYVTGAATKGGSAGASFSYVDPNGGGALATETKPSRAIPGEFVYSIGTNTPTTDDYNARTN